MSKTCVVCQSSFKLPSKRVTCSASCASSLANYNRDNRSASLRVGSLLPTGHDVSNLPAVETLPAAYVKRVHDLWESLITDAPTRIA